MKIILREEQLIANTSNLKHSEYMLPTFLFNDLKSHKTSLGDNPCFPMESKYPFDYKVIKDRYKEVVDNIKSMNLYSEDINEVVNLCNKLIEECKQVEKPIRDLLNDICKKTVKQILAIPDETVIFKCHLVDRIEPKKSPRILPEEDDEENGYTFDDVNDIEMSNSAVLKRRFINSLVQGASYDLSNQFDLFEDEIYKLDEKLPKLYKQIIVLTDYLLFNKKEKIDEKNFNQGAYVDVSLGNSNNKTTIDSQAIIFPYLLRESLRGFFELFGSHGLPAENDKAMYIIKHADFLTAEQWDMMFGVTLWKIISQGIDNNVIIPYYFSELSQLPTDMFNSEIKEILSNTKHGNDFKSDLIARCEREITFNDLPQDYQDDDVKSIISDNMVDNNDEMTIEELMNIQI